MLSYSIDTRGKDNFNVQVNTSIEWFLPDWKLANHMRRRVGLGPYFVLNRNSQEKTPQSNIEAGIRTTLSPAFYVPPMPLDGQPIAVRPKQKLNAALGFDVGYARTATYPDLEKAVCVATPDARQCHTQYKESVRSVAAAVLSIPHGSGGWGSGRSTIRYEFNPSIDVAYDHMLDNKINTKTNIIETGGYFSTAAGAKFGLFFHNDGRIKLEIAGQVRFRISVSSTRADGIERAAKLGTASLTYFFYQPPASDDGASITPDWKVGASVSFTRGSDPLTEKPDQSIIMLAFKVGRF